MERTRRILGILLMIIIFIISIILLAVSGGIIRNFYLYGDVFRRERDLSIFNAGISVCGIIISIFGLFVKISNRTTINKVAATACGLLGVCGIVSLIAAIAMSFLSVDYVTSRFVNNMMNYKVDGNARNSIDIIQRRYACCGSNIWLEWANVPLYTAPSNTDQMPVTSLSGLGTSAPSSPSNQSSINANTNSGAGDNTNTGNGLNSINTSPANMDVASIVNSQPQLQVKSAGYLGDSYGSSGHAPSSSFKQANKRKRQTQSNYGNIYGLPLSYSVSLPQSCCTNNAPSTSNSFDSYCVSNANNAPNSFHTAGCANKISKSAVSYALSIALINGFLVMFTLMAIPLFRKAHSGYMIPAKPYRNSSVQIQQGLGEHHAEKDTNSKTSIINHNSDYSVFQ